MTGTQDLPRVCHCHDDAASSLSPSEEVAGGHIEV